MGLIETAMETLKTGDISEQEKEHLLELDPFTDHFTGAMLAFRNDLYGLVITVVDGDHIATVSVAELTDAEAEEEKNGEWIGDLTEKMMEAAGIVAPRLMAIGVFQGVPRALYTADALGRAYETVAIGPLPLGRGHWGPRKDDDMTVELYAAARALWGKAWDAFGCWHSKEEDNG